MSNVNRFAPASTVIASWRDACLSKSLGTPSDWDSDAVAEFVEAQISDDIPRVLHASELFGRDLASSGTPISEGLKILYSYPEGTYTGGKDSRVVDALVEGWVSDSVNALRANGVTDENTSLRTPDYLVARLEEIYAEAARKGVPVDSEREFVLLTRAGNAGTDVPSVWNPRRMILADTLARIFGHGETCASLQRNRLAVVAFHEPLHAGQLAVLQSEMRHQSRESGSESARIELVTPPDAFVDALKVFDL